jgi:hypothetical protein
LVAANAALRQCERNVRDNYRASASVSEAALPPGHGLRRAARQSRQSCGSNWRSPTRGACQRRFATCTAGRLPTDGLSRAIPARASSKVVAQRSRRPSRSPRRVLCRRAARPRACGQPRSSAAGPAAAAYRVGRQSRRRPSRPRELSLGHVRCRRQGGRGSFEAGATAGGSSGSMVDSRTWSRPTRSIPTRRADPGALVHHDSGHTVTTMDSIGVSHAVAVQRAHKPFIEDGWAW